MIEFSVAGWSAWAPDLTTPEQWRAWAEQPWLPQGEAAPALLEVPAMQRRRIERLGRMAIQAACWCEQPEGESDVPLVFASRHGDVARSLALLQSLVGQEPMSPTAFGLSVHNAVAALYSIMRGSRSNYLALAAGAATVEAACVEAYGLLADGASEVRVIVYEAPLPALYAGFADEPDAGFAWCWRLRRADQPGTRLSLAWRAAEALPERPLLPRGLAALGFLLSEDGSMINTVDGQDWIWTRHG